MANPSTNSKRRKTGAARGGKAKYLLGTSVQEEILGDR